MFDDKIFNELIIATAGQGICVCQEIPEFPHVRFTVWNEAMTLLSGYTLGDINRLGWYQCMYPDLPTQQRAIARMQAMRTGDNMQNEAWEITRADGTKRKILITTRLIPQRAGPPQVLGVLNDITEHNRAELKIRHLANFPEYNPNPVLEFSPDGELLYRNPATIEMARKVGYADIQPLLPTEIREVVRACLASGEPRLRLANQHGTHHISWSFYPLQAQQVVHCYAGDITERLQMEERLRQKQKMEAIGQLAGGVAHDFNNLLTVIIGHVGLLRSCASMTPQIAESVEEISGAAVRAANLTRQLLAFSRHQVMTPQDLDLNQVVNQVSTMLRRVLGENVVIELRLSTEPQPFRGDTSMMEQVLLNLAVNARDAMPTGGTLTMTTQEVADLSGSDGVFHEGKYVKLTVSDTGMGIPAEALPYIFDPFFTTKEVGKGTGLGLATVFGVVQQHKGWVEVVSAVGQGSSFRLYLPRSQVAAEVPPPEPVTVPSEGHGEVILFVEDEPAVRELGVRALRRRGYHVHSAANAAEALTVWAEHKDQIALLLTDIIMPGGVTGLELGKKLLEQNPRLRVIYCSGYSAEIAGKEFILRDGVNYLGKPYELRRLFETVRMALDNKRSRSPF